MNKFLNSLSLKIGTIIILVEVIVLATLGIVYVNRFSDQVDRRVQAQVQLPGVLMNAGLMAFDAVSDPATMRKLVGDELMAGMVVGVNGNVFYALDPDLLGMDVADIPDVDTGLFDINNLQDVVIHDAERVISVSPIYASDQRTPRFFVYTVVSNLGATAEKTALTRLFIFGSLATMLLTSLVIIFSFEQLILKRVGGLAKVLRRVETGDMSTRVQGQISRDEIGFLQRSTNDMIDARQQAEVQIIHLNRVLQAIRNVNQLITQERDLNRLLESACDRLTETASYAAAWILLFDDDGAPTKFVWKDMEGNTLSLTEMFEGGKLMACTQAILAQADVRIIADGADVCQDCFLLSKRGSPYNVMAIRLEYDGKIYGALNITVLTEYTIDAEEISLFEELAGDISFALHSLEVEKERKRAEEDLEKYQQHLEDLVKERTNQLEGKTAELERANLHLQEADRLKSVFLASMSHELRTPLNSIIGFTGVILQGIVGEIREEQREPLTMVKNSANHLLSLINDLLDVSKIEAGKVDLSLEEVELDDLVKETVEAFSPAMNNKDLKLLSDIPNNITLFSDKRRVKQVLMNLIGNAVKFTENGSITITARALGDETLEIRVTDTGIGIRAEDMEKLFQPFQQIDASLTKQYEGTGLGLYLSKRILTLLEGSISARSKYGKGSEFAFVLPLKHKEHGGNEENTGG